MSNLVSRISKLEAIVAEKLAARKQSEGFAMITAKMVQVGPDNSKYHEFYDQHPHNIKQSTILVQKMTTNRLVQNWMSEHDTTVKPTIVAIYPDNNRPMNKPVK